MLGGSTLARGSQIRLAFAGRNAQCASAPFGDLKVSPRSRHAHAQLKASPASSASSSGAKSDVAMAKKTVRVDVTSDTVCPWCYVGKKNLEAAIGQLGDDVDVEVTWHPFQLNPSAPKEGVNKEAFYKEKFGPRVPMIMQRMSEIFASLGQTYSLGGLTGNTLDSHRLLWFARHGPQGNSQLQNALAEELFLDYFTRNKYLGDREVLVAAAERVGLNGAREFLSDPNAGVKEVQQEIKEFGKGVTGVPFFRIAGQQFSGAQPPEVFVEALSNAKGVAA